MNEIRWQRRKGSGIKYFRGLSYQLGKQSNTEAVSRREISMSRNQKLEEVHFVEEYTLHFWFWSASRGGIQVITNADVKLRGEVGVR